MAPYRGRRNGHSPQPHHFFYVVLSEGFRDDKLMIPPKFARDYGNALSSPVSLKVPNGQVWKFELTKCNNGEIWLENGWQKFAEHYSLEFGHFLVFRYEGNSQFHVIMLDKSASEVTYPYYKSNEEIELQEVKIEDSEDDDSVEIINNISSGKRQKPEPQSYRPHKMMRTYSIDKSERSLKSARGVSRLKIAEKYEALQRARNAFKTRNPSFLVLMQPTYVGQSQSHAFSLNIPKEFSREHLMDVEGDVNLCDSNGKTWSVELSTFQAINKQTYTKFCNGWGSFVRDNNLQVKDVCFFELIDCTKISFKVSISRDKETNCHGSQAFTSVAGSERDCGNLSTEDEDSVEIINKIYSGKTQKPEPQCCRPHKMMRTCRSDNPQRSLKSATGVNRMKVAEKCEALQRARNALKTRNPSFLVLMQPAYVGQSQSHSFSLFLPKEFSSEHLMDVEGDVTLCDSNGKTWSVELRSIQASSKQTYAKFCIGWRSFVRDNNLQVGDVCFFELTDCSKISFKVFISRDKETNSYGSQSFTTGVSNHSEREARNLSTHRQVLEPVKACETASQRTKKARENALQEAKAFTSENPYFHVVLQSSYVYKLPALYVPDKFSKKYFKSTFTRIGVVLCVPNGKSWPADYHQCTIGRPNGRIRKGWGEFVRENKLKVGDVCVLEMTDNTKICFNVIIYKATLDTNSQPAEGSAQEPLGSASLSPKAAKKEDSVLPFFRKVVLPFHLKEKHLDIPFRFVEQHFEPNIQKLILQVADRSWPVEMTSNPRSGIAKLTSGWIDFARENSLDIGDICVFEVDTVSSHLLKVSISKRGH